MGFFHLPFQKNDVRAPLSTKRVHDLIASVVDKKIAPIQKALEVQAKDLEAFKEDTQKNFDRLFALLEDKKKPKMPPLFRSTIHCTQHRKTSVLEYQEKSKKS